MHTILDKVQFSMGIVKASSLSPEQVPNDTTKQKLLTKRHVFFKQQ